MSRIFTPAQKARRRELENARNATPEGREKIRLKNAARALTEKGRAAIKRNNAKKMATPEGRAKVKARNASKTPEMVRTANKKRLAKPEGRAMHRHCALLRRHRMRNAARILLADPAMKREVISIYKEAAATGLTVDHIYPVRHPAVSGLHVPWNLRLVTKEENSRKRNMLPNEIGLEIGEVSSLA